MSEIKITELTIDQNPKMIDLKAEAEKGNEEAIIALKSLRGGAQRFRAPELLF
ncbi:hypothetical protein [Microcystis aeruginosa]|uniref:hypothetical protein n=1 Tax=Microcystis aeruginosa TaxID=1126 RepID=UPI00187F555B|nr:hypothetical protein [Microcystis aeruginosa]MBE8995859.1 hypothetical protein [Microcystis aeruginosa LEGE 91341]